MPERLSAEAADLLAGDLAVLGRIMPASNTTLLVEQCDSGLRCVYKPVAGERPLWDFPEGTLAGRECAAYAVSEALGWEVVPPTVWRDGPAGPGMVQRFVETDDTQHPVDLLPVGPAPAGFLHVLDALDGSGTPVQLVHEDTAALRRMAVFDVVVNNGDRKGGHVLPMEDGHRYGVDHGVAFHVDNRLRSVLWGWAGASLLDDERAALGALHTELGDASSTLTAALHQFVSAAEVAACRDRCTGLLQAGVLPFPSGDWPAIPWPAF
ncbi:MAG: SCO1664 family protein [Nocardioides sp.]|nr:SCO1664 family protein [Nocardioides sp.]